MYSFLQAQTQSDYQAAHLLFKEYAVWLNIDLCFQGFENELNSLPVMYGPPTGALILLQFNNQFVGCVGVRKISQSDCELKRMWIQKPHQKKGLGQQLLEKAIAIGKELGYQYMKLDTLQSMQGPIHLYLKNGFKEIPPYYPNPNAVVFFEKEL